jgi:hypothetical protein
MENIQASYLAPVKSKHAVIKRGIAMMNGNEVDDTAQPPQLIQIDPEVVKDIVSWVVYICETNQIPDEVQKYAENDHHSVVFITLYTIFAEAIRSRVTDKIFKDTLHCFNLPRKYQELINDAYTQNQQQLTAVFREETIAQESIEQFDWRVDIIISTTSLNKAFIPVIIMQITTTDGQIKTFECPINKFHQLRYSVAKMLANMQTIDQHPTLMRLID